MVSLDSNKGIPIPKLGLSRLPRNASANDISQWMGIADKINSSLSNLITASPDCFWSTLAFNENSRAMLDSINDFYIRIGFFNEFSAYLTNENVGKVVKSIYENNFFVHMQILFYFPKSFSSSQYTDLIYSRQIVTVSMLVKFTSIYGSQTEELCSSLLSNIFAREPRFYNDLGNFVSTVEQFMERAKSFLSDLASSLENNRVALNVSHAVCMLRIVDNSINIMLSLASFVRLVSPHSVWYSLTNNLPPFVEHMAKVLSDSFLAVIASSSDSKDFLGFLAYKRNILLQSIMHLFFTLYKLSIMTEQDRLLALYDAVVCKEFLVRFDDEIGVEKEYKRFIDLGLCNEDHWKTAQKLLKEAYTSKSRAIKVSLAQKRVLRDITRVGTDELEDALSSLMDLLPNYSREQLYLCLKNYNYDMERTTYALMEMAEMPLDLRILLRTKDNFSDVDAETVVTLPPFSDRRSDNFDSEFLEKENIEITEQKPKERPPIAAFSILPDSVAAMLPPIKTDNDSKPDRPSKLEMLVSRYGDMFDLSDISNILESIDKAQTVEQKELKIDNKTLVKPNLQRRKLMADKPLLTAEQEVSIRTTYDRYKYEMSDEDDEDGRYDLEARYAACVGQTGRFNQAEAVGKTSNNDGVKKPESYRFLAKADDDEYDDTYDDSDLFAVDDIIDEEEKNVNNVSSKPEHVDKGKRGPDQQRRRGDNGGAGSRNVPFNATNSDRPQASNTYLPSFAWPNAKGKKEAVGSDDGSEPVSSTQEPTPNVNRGQQQQRQSGPSTGHNAQRGGHNSGPSCGSSTSYTGGKARQNKERNKGKMKQRGADRKRRGGMF